MRNAARLPLAGTCLAAVVVLGACTPAPHRPSASAPSPPTLAAAWRSTSVARPLPGLTDLCEDRWESARPPGRPHDRIGLRRLALCPPARGPTPGAVPVLFFPGTHMNGTVAAVTEAHDFRLYLARRGVEIWSVDYRTHFVPPVDADLTFMRQWNDAVLLDDAALAVATVRAARGEERLVVAGFSRGVSIAYALAARDPRGIAGLVILDGVAPGAFPRARRASAAAAPAIDVGSRRLPYAERQALLDAVITAPGGPAGDPAFATAGERLAHILYTSAAFGGRGGLSDALHGCADIEAVARLLRSYDRYWPAAATPEVGTSPQGEPAAVPVFAVASGNLGPAFRDAVIASARAAGGNATTMVELPGCGHLDVLVGRNAPAAVFAPLQRWIEGLPR